MMSWTCCPFPSARAIRTPLNAPGIEPRQSHLTSPRCTVPRRRCTNEPTGFITALATRSEETAASGGTPKKSTSTGVISAPPPMPVRPTTMPIPNAASESNGSRWIRPPDHGNLRSQSDANPRLGGPARNHHRWTMHPTFLPRFSPRGYRDQSPRNVRCTPGLPANLRSRRPPLRQKIAGCSTKDGGAAGQSAGPARGKRLRHQEMTEVPGNYGRWLKTRDAAGKPGTRPGNAERGQKTWDAARKPGTRPGNAERGQKTWDAAGKPGTRPGNAERGQKTWDAARKRRTRPGNAGRGQKTWDAARKL